jgi:hypothetical protein
MEGCALVGVGETGNNRLLAAFDVFQEQTHGLATHRGIRVIQKPARIEAGWERRKFAEVEKKLTSEMGARGIQSSDEIRADVVAELGQ